MVPFRQNSNSKALGPNVAPVKLDFSSIPIWVNIYNLPLHWWSAGIIGKFSSAVDKPLYMDQATTRRSRIGFARACIEMNIKDIRLKIEYEWIPPKCSHCEVFWP